MSLTRKGWPGLTLIEILFALSVLAVALLGVAGMFPSALRSVYAGGQMTKATTLARQMADMIRGDSFGDLVSRYNGFSTNSLSVVCPVPPPTASALDPNYSKKKWTCDLRPTGGQDSGQGLPAGYGAISVDCVNADGTINPAVPCPTDLRRVTVTVTWQNQRARSVNLVTYVARSE